jgi:hypothetical protein
MTTLKVWCYALVALALMLFGWQVYVDCLAKMPPGVWRVVGVTWSAWASWHTYRLLVR